MREIVLSRGKVAWVDDVDFEWLNQWSWTFHGRYAYRKGRSSEGVLYKKSILMHRQILGVVDQSRDVEVDHINHDKLDNRRSNLRVCGRSQNLANQRLSSKSKSGYKGVCFLEGCTERPWSAYVTTNKKRVYLGYFETKEEAAAVYNQAALQNFGEFALLNRV